MTQHTTENTTNLFDSATRVNDAMRRPPRRDRAALEALLAETEELIALCDADPDQRVARVDGEQITARNLRGDNEYGLIRHRARIQAFLSRLS